jgi:uncharacterized membrane protein
MTLTIVTLALGASAALLIFIASIGASLANGRLWPLLIGVVISGLLMGLIIGTLLGTISTAV